MTEYNEEINEKLNISDSVSFKIEKIVFVEGTGIAKGTSTVKGVSGTMNAVIPQLQGNIQGHVENPKDAKLKLVTGELSSKYQVAEFDVRHLSPAGNSILVTFLVSMGAIVVGGTILQINEILLEGLTREDFLKWIKTFIKMMEYKN